MLMKRFIIPILIIAMLCSMVTISATASTYRKEENLLYNLGIVDTVNESPEKVITRIEMIKYVVSILNLPEGTFTNKDTEFEDVKADNDMSGYVAYALESGIISRGTYFRPNDIVSFSEAIKMIVSALGYDKLAQKEGGYPLGYSKLAQILGITDHVVVPGGGYVTRSVMTVLLYNAVNSELFSESFYTENGELHSAYYKGGSSLLYQQFGLSEYLAKINEIKGSKVQVEIIEDQSHDNTGKYKTGHILTAEIKSGVDVIRFEHTISYIWLDENNVLYNIELDNDIEVVNGFIDEINKTHKQGAEFDPRYIETVAIKGYEDYIDVAENCEFYYNGKKVTSGGYSFINAFSRAVVFEDEIIALECYNLKQGGMISQLDNNTITYSREENIESKIKNLLSYDEVTVFLNGSETELWALLPGVIFDYYLDEKENSILIVASSKCVTDVFVSISDDIINFENMEYKISENYGLYLGDGDKGYTKSKNLYDFLGMTVNAYIDYSGHVRYIGLYDEKEDMEFYGILTGYHENTFAEKHLFRLYKIQEGNITEEILQLSKKVTFENGANMTDIKSAIDSLKTRRSDAIKQSELVYLFKVNGKNEIVLIKKANLFDQCPDTGLAITSFSGQSYAYIPTPRIYFKESDICALYDDGGVVKAKMIKWSDLQYRSATGVNVFLYSDVLSSDIDLVLVRGDVETIAENREEVLKYGLLTKKRIALNPEDGEEIYNVTVGLQNFSVVKNMQDIKNINIPSFIEYGKCSTIFAENEIKVRNIYDLSKEPSEWTLSPDGSDGLHYGILRKNDNVRLFFEDGKAFYLSSGVTFHERSGGKFFDAESTDLEVGDEVWYIYRHGEIRAVFFNN